MERSNPPQSSIPISHVAVLASYRQRQAGLTAESEALRRQRKRVLRWWLLVMVLLWAGSKAGLSDSLSGVLLLLEVPAGVALIWQASRATAQIHRRQRLLAFYLRSLQRADGTEPQSGRTGLEADQQLRSPLHLYDHDLDILGPGSLFGMLNTVRTGLGERGLARYLLEPVPHAETLQRQASVQELVPETELREEIALLGASSFQQIPASFFDEWLDELPPTFHPLFRIALLITALVNVGLLLAGLLHALPWGTVLPNLALSLAVQGAISLFLRKRVTPFLNGPASLPRHIRLFADGLALLQSTKFNTAKLSRLRTQSLEPHGAVRLLKSLESQLAVVEQRPKEYFLLFSLLLAVGTQTAISLAAWKRNNADAMRTWLAAWAEFEALSALAAYAFEHPENAWPELLPDDVPPTYEAKGLGHPLLPHAVNNQIAFNGRTAFYLISGSNMAGKSTLLRSIGVNAVLAYAGAPVHAESLRLTPLAIGASLALTDSLAEGRSKFLAEVERLSAVVRLSADKPLLFLVDEIFSGTNSEDRRTAAAAVLNRLLQQGAIGALSTHDLALTELATAANGGVNVHMASPDRNDPLGFDFKLKPGVNTASNALAIVRMMGL